MQHKRAGNENKDACFVLILTSIHSINKRCNKMCNKIAIRESGGEVRLSGMYKTRDSFVLSRHLKSDLNM